MNSNARQNHRRFAEFSHVHRMVLTRAFLSATVCLALPLPAVADAPDLVAQSRPLSVTTVNEHSTASEGYVKPLDHWIESVEPHRTQAQKRHHHRDPDIWVADVGTLLFNDTDFDGYFSGFSVSIDVDVEWESADVYAEIYLQKTNAELALLHTTQVFTLYEQAISDRYRVEVDLLDNYPAGSYNVVVDVVNVTTGELSDSISYLTHRNLESLPLESSDYQPVVTTYSANDSHHHGDASPNSGHENSDTDDVNDADYEEEPTSEHNDHAPSHHHNSNHHDHGFQVEYGISARVTEYGGAAGFVWLLLLGTAVAFRHRHRNDSWSV